MIGEGIVLSDELRYIHCNVNVEQRKLFQVLIDKARVALIGDKKLSISISELEKKFNIKRSNGMLKRIFMELSECKMTYMKQQDMQIIRLLSEFSYNQTDNLIIYDFPNHIKQAIKNPELYPTINYYILHGFRNKYAVGIYYLLTKKRITKIEIQELRDYLKIGYEKYTMFSMFRQRVINLAVEEINRRTSLHVTYELHKIGRKYREIEFIVEQKN